MKVLTVLLLAAAFLAAQDANPERGYVLGIDDQIVVRVMDLDEINGTANGAATPIRIDMRGNIHLPVVGRVHAAGLTVEQLESQIAGRLHDLLQNPEVTVTIFEYRSQPVSVLGAVKNPGVLQIHGKKTLFEVLSLAGGLNPDAGNTINVTRPVAAGPLPLPDITKDSTGQFQIGQLSVKAVMDAKNPQDNILILPNDVVTVPKADLVYVIGAVKKSGGFVLSERETLSVLTALSLAEGLDRLAAPKNAKILRQNGAGAERSEIPVNVQSILAGKSKDLNMVANDILFIPTSMGKSAALRGMEAALTVGTGIAIYRP